MLNENNFEKVSTVIFEFVQYFKKEWSNVVKLGFKNFLVVIAIDWDKKRSNTPHRTQLRAENIE